MDLADIQRAALAARTHTETAEDGAVRVTLVVPTRHELTLAIARESSELNLRGAGAIAVTQRALLLAGLRGWEGVRLRHVLPNIAAEQAGELLPWSPDAVPLLLDAQPAWATAWSVRLLELTTARDQALEAARKN